MKSRVKKVLKIGALALLALFVLVTGIGFLLPRHVHCERSTVIAAAPGDIYPLIANFKDGWRSWNPFDTPDIQYAYSGPLEGLGATATFESSHGDGHMTIRNADPGRGVEFDLYLMHDSFRIGGSLLCAPADGGGTRLTWIDDLTYGTNPWLRWFGLFVKRPIESNFEKGLTTIKRMAEARATARVGTGMR
jgi:hypothetical protein